jgi:hypothetical protein
MAKEAALENISYLARRAIWQRFSKRSWQQVSWRHAGAA